jgi:raffinose/stachyose/melibiose transport system substrate-binding protein
MEQTARFEAENPGWTINWTWGGSEAMQKMRARINAGDPPDVAAQNDGNIAVMAREGVAVPLDEWLTGQNYEGDSVWQDTFYEGVLHHGYIADGADGAHYYGIPQGVHFSGIFYNKGMFDEGGYQIPATFDDLFTLCDQIQETEGIPCFTADNFVNYNARPVYYIMSRLVGYQQLYDTAMNKEGTSWANTPEFLEAAQLAQRLTTEYFAPGWQGNQWPTGQVEWANWGEAMIFMPSWLPSELLDTMADDFTMDLFPVPTIDGGYSDQTEYEIKFNGWFVPDGAKNADDAIYFIKYLTSQLVQNEQAVEGTIASPVNGVPLPDVLSSFQPILDSGTPMRFAAGLDADAVEWQAKVFFPLCDELVFGDITPEEFIEQLQAEHDAFYQ